MANAECRRAEICVIGGGPAGAAASQRLAVLGHDVLLVERERFPRNRIGESLPPSILPILEQLGVRETVEAEGFPRPRGAIFRWAGLDWYQGRDDGEPGFQVDRGRFDAVLLSAAGDSGVRIFQPAAAAAPERRKGGGWRVPIRQGGGRFEIDANVVVDASGAGSLLGGRKIRVSPPTLALYAYWTNVGLTGPETRVEAGDRQWYWGAPLPRGLVNAAVFVDPSALRGNGRLSLEEAYRTLLAQSELLGCCLDGQAASPVMACSASSRFTSPTIGADFIKVGDASFSLDPLSSQGVQRALVSALQGATIVHTMLRRPACTPQAMSFCRERQVEAVLADSKASSEIYRRQAEATGTRFWTRHPCDIAEPIMREQAPRSLPESNAPVCLSPDALLIPRPTICCEFVEPRLAVSHPSLDRSVAFLGDVPVAGLLPRPGETETLSELCRKLSASLTIKQASEVLDWLWQNEILIAADETMRS